MIDGSNDYNSATPKGFRLAFGIFMVLFYIAVGIAFILNFFKLNSDGISTSLGIVLIVYGIWRGVRLYIELKR